MKTLTTFGAMVSPANIQYAISNSGLRWKMHSAQWTSVQYWSLFNPSIVVKTIKKDEEESITEINNNPVMTLFGLPTKIDDSMSPHFIELYAHGELLFRIDGLAVPNGFPI